MIEIKKNSPEEFRSIGTYWCRYNNNIVEHHILYDYYENQEKNEFIELWMRVPVNLTLQKLQKFYDDRLNNA